MKKKVLFVDRDGTILVEPPDKQVDSLEKLEFVPRAISSLKALQDYGYELVMVSNQDGRGTKNFPEKTFRLPHEKMLSILKSEGVAFKHIFIDSSFEEENSPNRKPRTGLVAQYLLKEKTDLDSSYVIGDRLTDIHFASNIGCKSIFLGKRNSQACFSSASWPEIVDFLTGQQGRSVKLVRNTKETQISLMLNLDGNGHYDIDTGLSFYNHLLEQFTKHSGVDLTLKAKGDLHVDEHHTIEDVAIVLGQAFAKALGDKRGIKRYGFFILPTDEALAQCSLDFSGRAWLEFEGKFNRKMVGDFPAEMIVHCLKTFSDHARLTLHVKVEGKNVHHQLEAVFKALGRAVREAISVSGNALPTTKGQL